MIKRITKLGWITIFIIVFLTVYGMNHLTASETKDASMQLERKTDIQPKEHVPSKYSDIQFDLESNESDEYHLSLETPITTSDKVNDAINEWIATQKQKFLESIDEGKSDESHPSVRIRSTIDKVSDSFYQIQLTKEETDKPDKIEIINADTGNDHILTLDDVFEMNDDTLKTITKKIRENKDGADMTGEHLDETLEHPDNWNWTIDNEGFTLYVAADESIQIPLDSLYLYLNENIPHVIGMTEEQQKESADAVQAEKDRIQKEKEEREAKEKAKQEAKEKEAADTGEKYVALTFDDGPSAGVTPRVLDTLADHDAVATFFMLGDEVDTSPDVAKRVSDEGHEIGNHTKDHQDLTTLGPDAIRSEVSYTSDRIQEATGADPYLVRAPYGAYNDAVVQDLAANGDSLALWSIDSLDWKSRNADAINSEIQQNITSGAIVLMHDIHPTTADALPELLTSLEEQGYQFVTVSQLMEKQGLGGVGPHYGKS